MKEETKRYASYLLRVWRSETQGKACWRVSLEDTRSGKRQGFADLADAFAFLEARYGATNLHEPAGEMGQ